MIRRFWAVLAVFLVSFVSITASSAVVQSTSKPVSGVKFPWVVTIHNTFEGDRDQHICTGALIDDFTVITAAHCLIALADDDWVLVQGRVDSADRGRVLTPFDTKIHPDYDPITSNNDIAVIYLYYPAYSSSHLKLAGSNSKLLQGKLWLYGWGTNEFGEVTEQLRQAPQQAATKSAINDYFKSYDPQTQIAMRWFDRAKSAYAGACQGDSGGPLVKKIGKTNYLTGIVSYGGNQCSTAAPTVYTKVPQFRSWINETRLAGKTKHASEIKISTDPFFVTGGKSLPVIDSLDPVRGASLRSSVNLVTGDLPNDEIDISTLTVDSYLTPQQYGTVSLTAKNVGAWDACSMGTSGFIEVRIDIDGKLGSDRIWQYGELTTGCITDGSQMTLVKKSSAISEKCVARIQTTSFGPQVWFSADCFDGIKTALFRILLADGQAADVEPGSDNWMGPVRLQP